MNRFPRLSLSVSPWAAGLLKKRQGEKGVIEDGYEGAIEDMYEWGAIRGGSKRWNYDGDGGYRKASVPDVWLPGR